MYTLCKIKLNIIKRIILFLHIHDGRIILNIRASKKIIYFIRHYNGWRIHSGSEFIYNR